MPGKCPLCRLKCPESVGEFSSICEWSKCHDDMAKFERGKVATEFELSGPTLERIWFTAIGIAYWFNHFLYY